MEDQSRPYTRVSILEREITAFYKKEESLLKCITDRHVIKPELLPSPEETKELYIQAGIPEEKSEIIAGNYQIKLELLHDFQEGRTINRYHEFHTVHFSSDIALNRDR